MQKCKPTLSIFNLVLLFIKVRHVSKPAGSKPGMVIYVNYNTVYVTPDKELPKKLEEKDGGRG